MAEKDKNVGKDWWESFISPEITNRNVGQRFLHGATVGTAGDIGYISQRNKDRIIDYLNTHHTMPNMETLEEITGVQLIGHRGSEFYNQALAFAEEYVGSNPELQEAIEEQANKEGMSPEDFFWDESKIHEKGTKEADLYDFYRSMGEAQHEVGKTEIARSERDMQIEMAQQRQNLVDEVRKRRTNQLRSGLSSAQVANEEIQMLLMGQQAQQQTAQGFFDQRTQMNQQQQLNPYQAELQARQHIQGGQQGTSAHYAAFTADPIGTSKAYHGMSPSEKKSSIDWLKDRDD